MMKKSNSIYFSIFLIILLLVQAKAFADEEERDPKEDTIAKIRKVGIVSLVRNEFYPIYLGFTVFENHKIRKREIVDDLNQYIDSTFARIIKQRSKTVLFIPLKYERKQLTKGYQVTKSNETVFDTKLIATQLNEIFRKSGVDAIILITSATCADTATNSSARLENIGVLKRKSIGPNRIYSYICFYSELIGKKNILVLKGSGYTGHEYLTGTVWGSEKKEPNDKDIAFIINSLKRLIDNKANYQLEFFKLVPDSPVEIDD